MAKAASKLSQTLNKFTGIITFASSIGSPCVACRGQLRATDKDVFPTDNQTKHITMSLYTTQSHLTIKIQFNSTTYLK